MHPSFYSFFFFNDTATTEIYTLSLHDALPISLLFWRRGADSTYHRLDLCRVRTPRVLRARRGELPGPAHPARRRLGASQGAAGAPAHVPLPRRVAPCSAGRRHGVRAAAGGGVRRGVRAVGDQAVRHRLHGVPGRRRSEEHTSEIQSLAFFVCRLLL